MGWRSTFRQVQEPPWQASDASFQRSRVGEEWGWRHGVNWGSGEGHGVNWGSGENWRWQHFDRDRLRNAFDMGPHGGPLQPSYPHWGQQRDWQYDGAAAAAADASWSLTQQQQYLHSLPNDCFQQSSSYSTPTAAGYWQELPFHNNSANASMLNANERQKLPFHNNIANASMLDTSNWQELPYHNYSANASMFNTSGRLDDTGMIRSESRSQFQSRCLAFTKEEKRAKVSKEDRVEPLENNTICDKLALLEERNPTRCSKKKGKVIGSGAVVPKKKNKKKKSKNKVKRLQEPAGHPKENVEPNKVLKKGKSKIKKLQDMSINSKLDRNKIFQSLKAAGESIKETVKGQVDKVKNLLKPESKKGSGQKFSKVISKEGVHMGLTLDPYLMDLSELERVQREEEENFEEDLMLWEEGWGRDFKLKRVTEEEEEEDLKSPYWTDIKEVSCTFLFCLVQKVISQAGSDKARKALASVKFSNPVYTDPTNCLTFHGFKGRSLDVANAVPGSFNIYEGQRLPLAGAKRKDLDSTDHSTPSKVVKLVDFNQVMKSRCAEYLAKRQKDWVVTSLVEENWLEQLLLTKKEEIEFLVVFKRLRRALRENDNFLQYYSDREVP